MSSAMGISHSPRPVSRVWGGPRAPQAQAINATTVGLILLDSSLKLLYSNSEALRISAYPRQPRTALGAEFMKSIRVILGKKASVDDFPMVTHFTSGKRRYLCRTFVLEAAPVRDSKPAFLIILERQRRGLIALAARFQLTDREIQAVKHLADGLTSKEIAQRMNISPNTVKAFLRLIMLKMGVTTRSGVIGKLIGRESFDDRYLISA